MAEETLFWLMAKLRERSEIENNEKIEKLINIKGVELILQK